MNEVPFSDIPQYAKYEVDGVDPLKRLDFAKQILIVLALICIGVFAVYIWFPDNKAASSIFELIKIGALPLVTLVISFYFPNTSAK